MKKIVDRAMSFLRNYELSNRVAISILFAVTCIIFSPILFGGNIFLSGDTIMYTYPASYYLSAHPQVTINDLSLAGQPVDTAFHYGYFNPVYRLFFNLFGFLLGHHLIIFIDFLLAGLFGYLFLRGLTLGVYASLIGTLAFTFSQWSVYFMSSINVAHAVFLLPAVFYCALKILRGKWLFGALLGAIVGLALLGTHYQFIMLAVAFGGAFVLYDTYRNWHLKSSFVERVRPILIFFVSGLVSISIGWPQFVSTFGFFSSTMRSEFFVYQTVWYTDLLRYITPSFSLPRISTEEFFPYIGLVVLFFALYGLLRARKKYEYGNFFAFFFVLSTVACLKFSPLVLLLKYIPFLKYFAQPARFMYLGIFSLAVLSAMGFEYIQKHRDCLSLPSIRSYAQKIFMGIAGSILIANIAYLFFSKNIILSIQTYFDANLYAKTIGQPLSYYHGIIENLVQQVFKNISLGNGEVLAFFFFVFCLLWIFPKIVTKDGQLFANVSTILVILQVVLFSLSYTKLTKAEAIFGQSKIAEYVKKIEPDPASYRLFSFLVPFAQYQKITALHPDESVQAFNFAREGLQGNLHYFYDIPIAGGYEPAAFRRYQKLLFFLEDAGSIGSVEKKMSDFIQKKNVVSMLNIKYVVTPYKIADENFIERFEAIVTSFAIPLYLYENKEYLPRMYYPERIRFLSENAESFNLETVVGSDKRYDDLSFVECAVCSDSDSSHGLEIKEPSLSYIHKSTGAVQIRTNTAEERWLVFSQSAVPGWQAKIDTISTRIYTANHAFMAILVPKGSHMIEFVYKQKL